MKLQQRMQGVLDTLVQEGRERGIQLAVYVDGQLEVDAWAGLADAASGRPVDGETLFPVFSVTKGITATLLHLLVERGQLTYDTPIAAVWPAFAAHGKGGITVRHALGHTAGVPYLPREIGRAALLDWDGMCATVAQLHPVSPPGMITSYHALTYGWLVGEVVRRVDGRPLPQMLREEICRPLGITGLFFGIPDDVEPRVAVLDEIYAPGTGFVPPDDTVPQSVPGGLQPLHAMMNRPEARRACLPAANGIMNARALARHYAALLPGGVGGVALLPPERLRLATAWQRPGDERSIAEAGYFALGYALPGYPGEMGAPRPSFGHGGYGGSNGFAVPEHRLAVGLTKNLFSPHGAQEDVFRALRHALGIPVEA